MEFKELPLHEQVLEGTCAAHFTECMPVQERVLPISIEGCDVMVQSKTGSGKTAVYIITFLEKFLRNKDNGKSSSCLIVAPTRELAQQIADDAFVLCSKVKGFHVGCFYGGVGYEHQRKLLEMGCDIYVGTPGRLLEFMENGELDCKRIDTFVIDEADRLFDMGFYPDIRRMFKLLPPQDARQTMLFSATLEMRVRELAWEFMNNPKEIELEADHITVENITQELYHVAKCDKFKLFLQILAQEDPKSAIVFTNSKHMAEEVSQRLKLNGYNADYLTGDLPQAQRQSALNNLKNGKIAILVATDVAARGLQIDDLPLVVNYDIPEDYENYVHRIGRTARAGKSGKAITFADEEFVYGLDAIEKYIKMKIPVIWPENLPNIEDKSLKKKISSSQGSSQKTSQKLSQKSEKKSAKKVAKKVSKKVSKEEEPSQKIAEKRNTEKSIPHKSLGSMTETERLAYYKRKYGFEPKSSNNSNGSSFSITSKSSKITKASKVSKTTKNSSNMMETNEIKEDLPKTNEKSKIINFFKKLFGGKK